jgi:anti-sigma factor RsiW
MRIACTRDNTGRRTSGGPITAEDLNAYIDGELTGGRWRAIERLIACDAAAAVRADVESLRRLRELVRMAYTLNQEE